jgi:hypothetical protein
VGALGFDQRAQGDGIGHVDDVRAVRDLVTGRTRVAVNRNGFDAESLQGDQDFLAQFPCAQQQHADGSVRAGRTQQGRPLAIRMHGLESRQKGDYRMTSCARGREVTQVKPVAQAGRCDASHLVSEQAGDRRVPA